MQLLTIGINETNNHPPGLSLYSIGCWCKKLNDCEKKQAQQDRWIPVMEQSPPFGEQIQTWGSEGYGVRYLSKSHEILTKIELVYRLNFTHWKKEPTPPKL